MAQATFGIDHPLVTVRDHGLILSRYRALGFRPSPASHHPWGTVTALAMFPDNFIELIGVADAARLGAPEGLSDGGLSFGRFLGDFLARQEGLSLVALHSRDARADYGLALRRGLPGQGFIDFRRAMTKADGTPDVAVVSLALLVDDALPEASNFLCHQHRPELIWVPEWQDHPNGARGVAAVTYVAPVPAAAGALAARWRALYGDGRLRPAEVVGEVDGGVVADTGCGLLRSVTPERAEALYPGVAAPRFPTAALRPHGLSLTVAVESLDRAERALDAGGAPFHRTPRGTLAVPADFCGNVIVEFQAAAG